MSTIVITEEDHPALRRPHRLADLVTDLLNHISVKNAYLLLITKELQEARAKGWNTSEEHEVQARNLRLDLLRDSELLREPLGRILWADSEVGARVYPLAPVLEAVPGYDPSARANDELNSDGYRWGPRPFCTRYTDSEMQERIALSEKHRHHDTSEENV